MPPRQPRFEAAGGLRLPIGGHGGCRGACGEQGREAEDLSGTTLPTQHGPALVDLCG